MTNNSVTPRDIERLLISSTVRNGVSQVYSRGITPQHLFIWGDVLEFVLNHESQHGNTPTPETISLEFPDFTVEDSNAYDIDYLIDRTHDTFRRSKIRNVVEKVINNIEEGNVDSIVKSLSDAVFSVSSGFATKEIFAEDNELFINEYSNKRNSLLEGKAVGYSTGISSLDANGIDYINGEYVIIVGPPEIGKSWLLLASCSASYVAGKKVLFVSPEMPSKDLVVRAHTIIGRLMGYSFDNEALMSGNEIDMEQYTEFLSRMDHRRDFIVVDEFEGGDFNILKIEGIARKVKPDVIAVDMLPLLSASDGTQAVSWTSIFDVSSALKRLAVKLNCVVLSTSPSEPNSMDSTDPALMSGIGLGRYIAHSADLVMSISLGNGRNPMEKRRNMRIIKKRRGKPFGTDKFEIVFDPNFGIIG